MIDLAIARKITPGIIINYLSSEECIIDIQQISDEQLSLLLMVEVPSFYTNKGIDFRSPGAGCTTVT